MFFLAIVCLLNAPLAQAGDGDLPSPSPVYPPDAEVFGKKLNEWSAEWWQYILSTPQNPNPLLDTTGGFCTIVQHGPVWFLQGAIAGAGGVIRSCSIPEGKALFFPLLNLVDINITTQPVSELRAEIAGCLDAATNISLTVDGEDIPIGARSRVLSVPFAAVIPPDGVPTNPPVPAAIYSPAVDDGYYVMLRPLSVGPHTLHFTGASPGCDYSPTNFHVDPISVDVTYHLTIEPVSLQ
jgi:hypothetical protein